MRLRPLAAAHSVAASSSALATSGSSLVSKKPNIASLPPWNSSQRWSTWALIRPTGSAAAHGDEERHRGVLEVGVLPLVEELHPLEDQRCHPLRMGPVEAERNFDEALALASRSHRPDRHACHGCRNLHWWQ